jgi:hypothetical protein
MPADYLHNHKEFPELIRIVAEQKRFDPALVEKDYWIMHSLYGLQKQRSPHERSDMRGRGVPHVATLMAGYSRLGHLNCREAIVNLSWYL